MTACWNIESRSMATHARSRGRKTGIYRPKVVKRRVLQEHPDCEAAVDAAVDLAVEMLSKLQDYQTGDDDDRYEQDIVFLAGLLVKLIARSARIAVAAGPFVDFIMRWDRQPLSRVDDAFYSIHSGEDGASLRLSDLRKLRDAVKTA